jgi:hypothetical protein
MQNPCKTKGKIQQINQKSTRIKPGSIISKPCPNPIKPYQKPIKSLTKAYQNPIKTLSKAYQNPIQTQDRTRIITSRIAMEDPGSNQDKTTPNNKTNNKIRNNAKSL